MLKLVSILFVTSFSSGCGNEATFHEITLVDHDYVSCRYKCDDNGSTLIQDRQVGKCSEVYHHGDCKSAQRCELITD